MLRDLDRHGRVRQNALLTALQVEPTTRADISDALEEIRFAATPMNAIAKRIHELEGHSQALEGVNFELEEQNRELAVQLGKTTQERDAMAALLKGEQKRAESLKMTIAQCVARANVFEHDLAATKSDPIEIVELVRKSLGPRA